MSKHTSTVLIDFPETHQSDKNPYPIVYRNVVAHFFGIILRDEQGTYTSMVDYGLDSKRYPKDIESQNIGDKVSELSPFLNELPQKFKDQAKALNCSDRHQSV